MRKITIAITRQDVWEKAVPLLYYNFINTAYTLMESSTNSTYATAVFTNPEEKSITITYNWDDFVLTLNYPDNTSEQYKLVFWGYWGMNSNEGAPTFTIGDEE